MGAVTKERGRESEECEGERREEDENEGETRQQERMSDDAAQKPSDIRDKRGEERDVCDKRVKTDKRTQSSEQEVCAYACLKNGRTSTDNCQGP